MPRLSRSKLLARYGKQNGRSKSKKKKRHSWLPEPGSGEMRIVVGRKLQ